MEGEDHENGLEVDGIIGSDIGWRRQEQFKELRKRGFEPGNTVSYDDSGENLAIAKSMGIFPVAAPQGYDLPERIAGYRQATPLEFPGVVKEIFGI